LPESEAEVLILLGDQPIRWFLRRYDRKRSHLSQFGETPQEYGKIRRVSVDGHPIQVLPLAHPRQIAKLGRSSAIWYELHRRWVGGAARTVLSSDGRGQGDAR